MTLDELRDWHARRAGWTQKIEGDFEDAKWCLHHHSQWDHPFPPTLDAADASFPKGRVWYRYLDYFSGLVWKCGEVAIYDTGDKPRDLYELSKLAWEQEAAR